MSKINLKLVLLLQNNSKFLGTEEWRTPFLWKWNVFMNDLVDLISFWAKITFILKQTKVKKKDPFFETVHPFDISGVLMKTTDLLFTDYFLKNIVGDFMTEKSRKIVGKRFGEMRCFRFHFLSTRNVNIFISQ